MEFDWLAFCEQNDWASEYSETCSCPACGAWRVQMGSPAKTPTWTVSVTTSTAVPDPVLNIAGPEEVTTQTYVFGPEVTEVWTEESALIETPEQRNERIWQAIKDAAQG